MSDVKVVPIEDTVASAAVDGGQVEQQDKGGFSFPHPITFLGLIILIVWLLTLVIPAGTYNRVDGRPVGGTFHQVPSPLDVRGHVANLLLSPINGLYGIRSPDTGQVGPFASGSLFGKGIMYDSGGIGLKPNNRVHAQMKNDMTGAAAILAAVAALDELGCRTAVSGYLLCTDNMPSATAMALGDVIRVHGGTTVEVLDSDAEGRLVLSDGLALAAEQGPDAIVDIATLTGSCLRALGPDLAGVFGTDQALVEQVKRAADASGEPVWQLPLHRRYGEDLYSGVADLRNIGADAVPDAIVAALFLSHFVGGVPWVHLDICGPAQHDGDRGWHTDGPSGFGARLLLELAVTFQARAARPAGGS